MGTTCVHSVSFSLLFFSCSPGGGGILPAYALRKSARPVALRMPYTTVVVVVDSRAKLALENSGHGSLLLLEKRSHAIDVSREYRAGRKRVSSFRGRMHASYTGCSRLVWVYFNDWRTLEWITITVLIFSSPFSTSFLSFYSWITYYFFGARTLPFEIISNKKYGRILESQHCNYIYISVIYIFIYL